jgi:hypothetical protein
VESDNIGATSRLRFSSPQLAYTHFSASGGARAEFCTVLPAAVVLPRNRIVEPAPDGRVSCQGPDQQPADYDHDYAFVGKLHAREWDFAIHRIGARQQRRGDLEHGPIYYVQRCWQQRRRPRYDQLPHQFYDGLYRAATDSGQPLLDNHHSHVERRQHRVFAGASAGTGLRCDEFLSRHDSDWWNLPIRGHRNGKQQHGGPRSLLAANPFERRTDYLERFLHCPSLRNFACDYYGGLGIRYEF